MDTTNAMAPSKDSVGTVVSLFSGAMGLDLGFEMAGFKTVFASDISNDACDVIEANRPGIPVFRGDARDLSGSKIKKLSGISSSPTVVIGGPPCQSFSTVGRRRGLDGDKGPLVFEFARLVGELNPDYFVMENVKGLLSSPLHKIDLPEENNGRRIPGVHGKLFDTLIEKFEDLGYVISHNLLNAADFGVPQRRIRLFIVGSRVGPSFEFPNPTHSNNPDSTNTKSWRSIGDVISDLTLNEDECAKFSERKTMWLDKIPEGGNWRNLSLEEQEESMGRAFFAKGGRTGWWRRLSMASPAPTLLTEPQNSSTSLCHPIETRPLSVREYLRIQTFPDDWILSGSTRIRYRLIGNAVPVTLSAAIAEKLVDSLLVN